MEAAITIGIWKFTISLTISLSKTGDSTITECKKEQQKND